MRTQTKPTFASSQPAPRNGANLATMGGNDAEIATQQTTTHVIAALMHDRQRRDMDRVVKQVLFEAGRMAENYYYSWAVGRDKDTGEQKFVEGATIGAAEMLMRVWGNCTCVPKLIDEDATHWLIEATFIDLEQGVAYPRLFKQRKSESHQRGDDERLMDIAFQIGQSKALRNAILAGVPAWLEDDARTAAKKAAAMKFQNVEGEWPKYLAKLAKLNVSEAQIRTRLGIGPGDKVTAEHLATLASVGRAIKERQTTLEAEFFGTTTGSDTLDEAAKAIADAAKAAADAHVAMEAAKAAEAAIAAARAAGALGEVADKPKSADKKTAPAKKE